MVERNGFENPYAHVIGSPTREESWVYPVNAGTRPGIRVQWLTFQGPEFEALFDTRAARDAAAAALFGAYAPEAERAIRGRDPWDVVRAEGLGSSEPGFHLRMTDIEDRIALAARGEFTAREATITPDMVAALVDPGTRFRITPTSLGARRQFERLGFEFEGRATAEMDGAEVLDRLAAVAPPAPGM